MGSPDQRSYCRAQAIATSAGTGSAEQLYENCIRKALDTSARKNQDPKPQNNTERSDSIKSYTYCKFHQEEVHLAYQRQHALGGRIPSFERDFGTEHPRTIAAKADYQEAVDELAKLIPEFYRQGTPLIPDAGEKFSLCKRSDFSLP